MQRPLSYAFIAIALVFICWFVVGFVVGGGGGGGGCGAVFFTMNLFVIIFPNPHAFICMMF